MFTISISPKAKYWDIGVHIPVCDLYSDLLRNTLPKSSPPLKCWKQRRRFLNFTVDVCGTVSICSYIQIIDVPSVQEEAPLEASGCHGAAGCVTSSLFIS
jgi:hypothetical protein